MATSIKDMTDIELHDELAELLGGPSYEQEVDYLMKRHAALDGTRLSWERAYKRALARHRARQAWALEILRAEEMAGGPVDVPPPRP
jgi:hypothetical protein